MPTLKEDIKNEFQMSPEEVVLTAKFLKLFDPQTAELADQITALNFNAPSDSVTIMKIEFLNLQLKKIVENSFNHHLEQIEEKFDAFTISLRKLLEHNRLPDTDNLINSNSFNNFLISKFVQCILTKDDKAAKQVEKLFYDSISMIYDRETKEYIIKDFEFLKEDLSCHVRADTILKTILKLPQDVNYDRAISELTRILTYFYESESSVLDLFQTLNDIKDPAEKAKAFHTLIDVGVENEEIDINNPLWLNPIQLTEKSYLVQRCKMDPADIISQDFEDFEDFFIENTKGSLTINDYIHTQYGSPNKFMFVAISHLTEIGENNDTALCEDIKKVIDAAINKEEINDALKKSISNIYQSLVQSTREAFDESVIEDKTNDKLRQNIQNVYEHPPQVKTDDDDLASMIDDAYANPNQQNTDIPNEEDDHDEGSSTDTDGETPSGPQNSITEPFSQPQKIETTELTPQDPSNPKPFQHIDPNAENATDTPLILPIDEFETDPKTGRMIEVPSTSPLDNTELTTDADTDRIVEVPSMLPFDNLEESQQFAINKTSDDAMIIFTLPPETLAQKSVFVSIPSFSGNQFITNPQALTQQKIAPIITLPTQQQSFVYRATGTDGTNIKSNTWRSSSTASNNIVHMNGYTNRSINPVTVRMGGMLYRAAQNPQFHIMAGALGLLGITKMYEATSNSSRDIEDLLIKDTEMPSTDRFVLSVRLGLNQFVEIPTGIVVKTLTLGATSSSSSGETQTSPFHSQEELARMERQENIARLIIPFAKSYHKQAITAIDECKTLLSNIDACYLLYPKLSTSNREENQTIFKNGHQLLHSLGIKDTQKNKLYSYTTINAVLDKTKRKTILDKAIAQHNKTQAETILSTYGMVYNAEQKCFDYPDLHIHKPRLIEKTIKESVFYRRPNSFDFQNSAPLQRHNTSFSLKSPFSHHKISSQHVLPDSKR